MNTRLNVSFVSAGFALIVFTGCVSSRKYKASQAELAKVRSDSAQQAQQISSLNGNVHDLQDKNTGLQRSLDSSTSSYATQQKSLDYYQGYFKDQQATLSQVSDDVKGALTQAGVSNADVQQVNNAIYVRLDGDELFKKNSTMVTPGGKKVLSGLAGVIKSRSNVNVFVGSNDSAIASTSSADMSAASDMAAAPRPHHHHHAHPANSSTASGNGSAPAASSANGNVATNNTTTSGASTHPKVHHKYSAEGSTAIYTGNGRTHNRAWAIKQGRMVTVANHFLQNGVPKVHVSLQQPNPNGSSDQTIKVIITPKMEDFNPQQINSSASTR